MKLSELITRVRSYTRDTTGTLFTSSDVKDFINEGIDKFRQISQLNGMQYLSNDNESPILLPSQYHYALAIYGASRCLMQDEQHYASQTYMDEFLSLYNLIDLGIKEGLIVIVDDKGETINDNKDFDYVRNIYFNTEV